MRGVRVYGEGHLADVHRFALETRGLERDKVGADVLGLVVEDVTDHASSSQLDRVASQFEEAGRNHPVVVIMSQVPPGWTRRAAGGRLGVYYQVDTIIVKSAVVRVTQPEQIIVGCADPDDSLPLVYQTYLWRMGHRLECPVLQMSYESAELAKCGINYVLTKQIEAANALARAAEACGADYADVERTLRGDARIGLRAYLKPGSANQHLIRDVATVSKLAGSLPWART